MSHRAVCPVREGGYYEAKVWMGYRPMAAPTGGIFSAVRWPASARPSGSWSASVMLASLAGRAGCRRSARCSPGILMW
jgi:hypothetical protein